MLRWIEAFRRTIVCEKCRDHFTTLLKEYTRAFPDWNASRKNINLFIFRAHNTVNLRTHKKVYSMNEAFALIRGHVDPSKAHLQRQSYLMYVRRDWLRDNSIAGISAVRFIKELMLTETEYWSQRSFNWDEIEELIKNDSNAPLPSQHARDTRVIERYVRPSAPPAPQTQPVQKPRLSILGGVPIPRFSFVSR